MILYKVNIAMKIIILISMRMVHINKEVVMDSRVNKLMGSNMDIDFISDIKFGDTQCPWNVADDTN